MKQRAPAEVMHSGILDELGQEIADGTLVSGTAMTLSLLEERFGISRTVAREVMRSLEGAGLVESKRRLGIVIQPASNWNVLDPRVVQWRLNGPGRSEQLRTLTELRAGVEPLAAAAAASNATEAQRAKLIELAQTLARLSQGPTSAEFHAADSEFHTLLLEASGNDMFRALTKILQTSLTSRVQRDEFPATPSKQAIDSHVAVANAIGTKDAGLAFQLMVAMLAKLRTELFPTE